METRLSAFYFGTYGEPGHHLWQAARPGKWIRHGWPWNGEPSPLPWDKIDGQLNPSEKQGEAALHHKDVWTALAFADRSVDSRPGSNSAFFFSDVLTFDQAAAEAKTWFPHVTQRFSFEIVDASSPAAMGFLVPDTITLCARCGYSAWRDGYPCNRCGGLDARVYAPVGEACA